MNDIRDMQYLALELTKLRLEYKNNNMIINKQDIIDTYNYYLKKLSNDKQETENIEELQAEIDRLSRLLGNFEMNNDIVLLKQQLSAIVREGKANMEPYLYEQLMDVLGKWDTNVSFFFLFVYKKYLTLLRLWDILNLQVK